MMRPVEADAASLPASLEQCRDVLIVVHGAMGLGPAVSTADPERLTAADSAAVEAFNDRLYETAEILACGGWTLAEIRAAARLLASSPDLDDKIRYGRPITAADFERVRRDGETEAKRTDREGVDRVLITRTGFALKVAQARLYTRGEAFALWEAGGSWGTFSDSFQKRHADSMFFPVAVEDGRTLFRLKG